MQNIFLGIGSNLGDRKKNILNAIRHIGNHKDILIKAKASLIDNPAVSKDKQPNFLNTVIEIETLLSAESLLEVTKNIEFTLKRTTKGNYAPRTIDIDILFYGDDIILRDNLTIPHPLLHERKFVLLPLVEIAPDFIHPIIGDSIKNIYEEFIKWDN